MFVKRDRDTDDGGKKGEITTNPKEVDGIVKRAWKAVYDGVGQNVFNVIQAFFKDFAAVMFHGKEFELGDLDAEMVHDSFRRTTQSVGAMDGWQPKELAYLSLKICGHIATMLNQIEAGSPWPTSTRHARVVYLEK